MSQTLKPPAPFLPMSRKDMEALGWDALDVLLVTGDAYVDHPAFGASVIGRALEAAGYRVGIVAQPDWTNPKTFEAMGAPKLFVGVTAGAMDSMVSNYTAGKKPRRSDAYTPGGEKGKRPNNATIVYTNVVRHVFPGVPVVIGGIEASLRRFAYYDYWKDRVRRSVLFDSKADLLAACMAESTVVEIAQRLKAGRHLHRIPGTVEAIPADPVPKGLLKGSVALPEFETVRDSKKEFMEAALKLEKALVCGETSEGGRKPIVQRHGDRFAIEWPPEPLTPKALDAVYALPFQRRSHPSYAEKVPALEPVQFSVVSHRGCFGGCTFCALALHQGRRVVSRSAKSVLDEIERLTKHEDFHGSITDVGGPTANMYGMQPQAEAACAKCQRPSCLYPDICKNLDESPRLHLSLLRHALDIPGVKHLFIASGLRHDLMLPKAPNQPKPPPRRKPLGRPAHFRTNSERTDIAMRDSYFELLVRRLVGGHLSVAPEHVASGVLRRMRKPRIESYIEFAKRFEERSKQADKEQYITPYFIASFPGSTEEDMKTLMRFLKLGGRKLQQVQDFLPGPMTVASAMYHAELDSETLTKIHVAKSEGERRRQREQLLYHQEKTDSPHAGPHSKSKATAKPKIKPKPKTGRRPSHEARSPYGPKTETKPKGRGSSPAPNRKASTRDSKRKSTPRPPRKGHGGGKR